MDPHETALSGQVLYVINLVHMNRNH
jgi:hypothetical protein